MAIYIPRDPDNVSIKATLEEMKKLNRSSASYNKLIIIVASATLVVSIIGVIISFVK